MSDSTTLGAEIFRSRNIGDIRQSLEKKALCCLLHGQRDMFMVVPVQLSNRHLAHAYHLVSISPNLTDLLRMDNPTGDILRHCFIDGLPPILSDSPQPTWGEDDAELLELITRIEALESAARQGGRLL